MISLFMQGGPSHVDLLDPKPQLTKYDGQKFPGTIKYDNAAQSSAKALGSPWKFQKHGQCGTEVSELLPGLAEVVDDICVIRSTHTGVNNHVQSINALQSGRILAGRPSLGSWVVYGLGAESQNLPAFVALTDPESLPVGGVSHWSNGWLPSLFQGTVVRPREPRILNLDPPEHLQGAPRRVLRADAGAFDQKDERRGAAVHDRHLGPSEVEQRVVDAAAAQGGEQVLDRADARPVRNAKRRRHPAVDHMPDVGRHLEAVGVAVDAPEPDAGIDRRRAQRQRCHPPGMQADATTGDGRSKSLLPKSVRGPGQDRPPTIV